MKHIELLDELFELDGTLLFFQSRLPLGAVLWDQRQILNHLVANYTWAANPHLNKNHELKEHDLNGHDLYGYMLFDQGKTDEIFPTRLLASDRLIEQVHRSFAPEQIKTVWQLPSRMRHRETLQAFLDQFQAA